MDVANVLMRTLSTASAAIVPALTNVWTMINKNPQATNIVTAAIASQYAPGSVITGTGTILVGFAKLTAKILIGFLVAVAVYLVAYYGIELSGTSVDNIKEKLNDIRIEKLWDMTKATAIKLMNTTQEIVSNFGNNPQVQKLKEQFRTFIDYAKSKFQKEMTSEELIEFLEEGENPEPSMTSKEFKKFVEEEKKTQSK